MVLSSTVLFEIGTHQSLPAGGLQVTDRVGESSITVGLNLLKLRQLTFVRPFSYLVVQTPLVSSPAIGPMGRFRRLQILPEMNFFIAFRSSNYTAGGARTGLNSGL
jgi:hypothetical protein